VSITDEIIGVYQLLGRRKCPVSPKDYAYATDYYNLTWKERWQFALPFNTKPYLS